MLREALFTESKRVVWTAAVAVGLRQMERTELGFDQVTMDAVKEQVTIAEKLRSCEGFQRAIDHLKAHMVQSERVDWVSALGCFERILGSSQDAHVRVRCAYCMQELIRSVLSSSAQLHIGAFKKAVARTIIPGQSAIVNALQDCNDAVREAAVGYICVLLGSSTPNGNERAVVHPVIRFRGMP